MRRLAVRLVSIPLVVWLTATFLFFLLRLSGDPVALLMGFDTSRDREALVRQQLALDRPLYAQYAKFLSDAVRLQFGESYRHNRDAMTLVVERLPATIELGVAAFILVFLVAFPAGIVAAVRRTGMSRAAVMGGALLGQSVPSFWLGILLILLFSVRFRLLPAFGRGQVAHLVLPMITLAAPLIARQARLVRSGMLEVLAEDYIRTARAKGLRERSVVARHALRNMLIPIVAVAGVDIRYLVGGAIVVETVFAWPGMGQLMISSVLARDYPVVQAAVFVIALVVAVVNAGIDLGYYAIDPRMRR